MCKFKTWLIHKLGGFTDKDIINKLVSQPVDLIRENYKIESVSACTAYPIKGSRPFAYGLNEFELREIDFNNAFNQMIRTIKDEKLYEELTSVDYARNETLHKYTIYIIKKEDKNETQT